MTIDAIRNHICHHVGYDVVVIYNEGRNKVHRYHGKVTEVYHSVFIVMDNNNKKSFSYYDVLTKTAKISFNCKNNVKL